MVVRGVDEAREGFRLKLASPPPPYLSVTIDQEAANKAKLKVTLRADAPLGELNRPLTFTTGVPKQPTFDLQVNGLINPRIVGPSAVHFGDVDRAAGGERAIALERRDGNQGIPVAQVRTSAPALLEVEVHPVTGARAECTLRVRPEAPPGPFAATVWILLDDPDQALVAIPVYGRVVPRVAVDPPVVLLGAGSQSGGPIGRVEVAVQGPGSITGVTVEGASGLEPCQQGGAIELHAGGPVEVGPEARLVIRTDVAGEEQVTVPLVGR